MSEEKEKKKRFSKYFGGEYMKYWYIAFAITVVLMAVHHIMERSIDSFKYTEYNEDGSIAKEMVISQEETETRARSSNSRSIVPEKPF